MLFFPVFSPSSFAQDISALIPFANYTLINTDEDALGLQEPMELEHAPFADSDGVYSNGLYIGDHPDDGSYIRTPFMSALYDSVFAIELEFNLEELGAATKPILVCGQSYRYIGFTVRYDSLFQVLYNNSNLIPITGAVAQTAKWYTLTILHHENSSLNEFYLDGSLLTQFYAAFDRSDQDGIITNINPSSGTAFKGYWRNLRIYGSEMVSAATDVRKRDTSIGIFPNPSASNIRIEYHEINATRWTITDFSGVQLLSGNMLDMQDELDIQILTPGVYILHMYDDAGILLAHQKFVKN